MKNICLVFALVVTLVTGISALPANSLASSAKNTTETVEKLSGKVDINTADVEMLSTLPGVGPKTAAAIAAYRNENGKFTSVDDLLNIKGIGNKKLEKMKPFLQAI